MEELRVPLGVSVGQQVEEPAVSEQQVAARRVEVQVEALVAGLVLA